MPITEDAPVQTAMSPYGNTKQIGEEIISDTAKDKINLAHRQIIAFAIIKQ